MATRLIRIYPGRPASPETEDAGSSVIGFSRSISSGEAVELGNILVEIGLAKTVSDPIFRPSIVFAGDDYTPHPSLPETSVSILHLEVKPPLPDDLDPDRVRLLGQLCSWNIDTGDNSGALVDNRSIPPGEDMLNGRLLASW